MSKWYRPSFSLAAKCRIGFATAVLLIIGTALILPLRWTDKLVEENRRDIARLHAHSVLERHFANPELTARESGPPLFFQDGMESPTVDIAQWRAWHPRLDMQQHQTDDEENPRMDNEPVTEQNVEVGDQESDDETDPNGLGEANVDTRITLKSEAYWLTKRSIIREDTSMGVSNPTNTTDSSFTQWIPLPPILTQPREPLQEDRIATAEESGEAPEEDILIQTFRYHALRDPFLRRAISHFIKHPEDGERFTLHDRDILEYIRENQEGEARTERLQPLPETSHYSHYVRSVWATKDCTESGCHGGVIERGSNNATDEGPVVFHEGQLVGVISVIMPESLLGTTLFFNRVFIIMAGLLAGICAIVTFYLITQRFILEPVRRLREAADALTIPVDESKQPDEGQAWQKVLDLTDHIKTGDEYEQLADAFHQMLVRLKIAQDRLQENYRALDMRLGEIQEKNIALFEANKLKSEFLANVSHELRTPLNAIIGFAEILQEQAQKRHDEKGLRYVGNVRESGKMLLKIINDLLDLAKIEAGKMEISWEKCHINDIIETLVNLTRPLAEAKQLNVNVQAADDIGLIESDAGKVQQILFNLLSNAIKFTPAKGRIDIKAWRKDEDCLVLTVEDSGTGISKEDQSKIFEKFRQLDASVTREHSGTGLGLAIVKELVEVLGGSIHVESEPGKGSVFIVELPTKKPRITKAQYFENPMTDDEGYLY